jgi:outer membrane protein assembly factor BamB
LLAVALIAAGCVGLDDPDGWAAPTAAEGTLYLTVDSGELIAVDPDTYDELWVFPENDEEVCGTAEPRDLDLDGLYGSPVVADGVVYFGAWDGFVYALDAASGECLWDFETGDPIIAGVVLDSDRLYAASTDENLYVLDPATGAEIDSIKAGDVWSTPLLIDGTLYVSNVDGELLAFDAATLDATWASSFNTNAGLLTDLVAVNGDIIAGGIGGTLYAVDAATGSEQWAFDEASSWYWGTPLVDEDSGIIYATNLDNSIYAIDADTGDGIWEFQGEALFRAGATMAGNTIISVDDDGMAWGLDAATGDLIWNGPTELEESTFATPLALDDATVLIVARNGDVFNVDVESGRLTTVNIN